MLETALDLLDMLYPDADFAQRSERTAQKRALMEDVRASGDGSRCQSAVSAQAAYAVSEGELDRAEALLDELPQQAEDAPPTRVRLYLARGQRGGMSSPFCMPARYYGKVFRSFAGNAQKRKKQLV